MKISFWEFISVAGGEREMEERGEKVKGRRKETTRETGDKR